MTDSTAPSVPAGWYPDPWGSSRERWWNGTSWTDTLAEEGPSAPVGQELPTVDFGTAQAQSADAEASYEPTLARSTYESAATPVDAQSLPSRRALRHQSSDAPQPAAEHPPVPEQPVPEPQSAAAAVAAAPLPPLTQAPQYTPEPTGSALPAPVFTDPEPTPAEPDVPDEPAPDTAAPSNLPTSADDAAPVEAPAPAHTSVPHAPAPPPTTDASDDGWAASLRTWDSLESSTTAPDAVPIFGDVPPISYTHRTTPYQPLHGRTSPVWLIVVMPLIHTAAVIGSLFLFPELLRFDDGIPALVANATSLAALQDWMVFAAAPLSIAFFLFTLIMGFQDRTRLRLLGHERTASPWWVVLHPLIYLIVRSVHVRAGTGRRGSGPLTTYLCLYVAPPLALVVTTAVVTALDGALPV